MADHPTAAPAPAQQVPIQPATTAPQPDTTQPAKAAPNQPQEPKKL